MVIVEFFDKTALENICGALLCQPDRVILVGSDRKKMERSVTLYQGVLRKRGINTEFSSIPLTRNHLNTIVEKLSRIIEENEDCIFDLTGGDEMYLVAVGIIMGRYGNRVQCHRFNFTEDRLCDCDADGEVLDVKSFDISIEDNIAIYDGKIVTEVSEDFYTYSWDMNEDFLSDVKEMWEVCRKNPKLWNSQISTLGAIYERLGDSTGLLMEFDQKDAERMLERERMRYTCAPMILSELQRRGLISSLYLDGAVRFKFKNDQVKRCLTVAGQILELYVAAGLLTIKDKDGAPLYNDVKVGAVIKWGQLDVPYETPTVNEIDVVAMKGAIPIFISCKNGYFDTNELYKLSAVADRFGNKYAKKALVVTDTDALGSKKEYILARMDDMDIRCISDLDRMEDEKLYRSLSSLWKN